MLEITMKKIRIAIVIPALDEEKYIGKCLLSVLNSYMNLSSDEKKNVFIVVADNNSVDRTKEIVDVFRKKYPNIFKITENKIGQGYARSAGVNFVLRYLYKSEEDYWIISTDADVQVPKNWLSKWFKILQNENVSTIITGNSQFDSLFEKNYPNSTIVLEKLFQNILKLEKLFGVINVDGFNSAIKLDTYSKVGPYIQPIKKLDSGKIVNLAGEDWDLSTRARILTFTVKRNIFSTVTTSSRRFEFNPKKYLNGTTYESSFSKIDGDFTGLDIPKEKIKYYINIGNLRLCTHFVEKIILVDNKILKKIDVKKKLGTDLIVNIQNTILNEKPPDFLQERNMFIEYLLFFHKQYGEKIKERLFSVE